jgi:hypothetical protein
VKWSRAIYHVEALARRCAEMSDSPTAGFLLPVRQLWAHGDVLGSPRDLDVVQVALSVDLPAEEVPWLGRPSGAEHWANAMRLTRNPVVALWRSVHAPVWNHEIVRPVLVWEQPARVFEEALAALRAGDAERVRPPAPTAAALRTRLEDDIAVSLSSLRQRTATYERERWSRGKLAPLADALWEASAGYVDLVDAVDG